MNQILNHLLYLSQLRLEHEVHFLIHPQIKENFLHDFVDMRAHYQVVQHDIHFLRQLPRLLNELVQLRHRSLLILYLHRLQHGLADLPLLLQGTHCQFDVQVLHLMIVRVAQPHRAHAILKQVWADFFQINLVVADGEDLINHGLVGERRQLRSNQVHSPVNNEQGVQLGLRRVGKVLNRLALLQNVNHLAREGAFCVNVVEFAMDEFEPLDGLGHYLEVGEIVVERSLTSESIQL